MKERKPITREEALLKMADLCARSEQCSFEIEKKLRLKGLVPAAIEYVLEELKRRKFVDDSRYARSFARDKVRFSGWGRLKIRAELAARRIGNADISAAMEGIEEADYEEAIRRASRSKAQMLDLEEYADRVKMARYLYSRGFEPEVASREVRRLRAEKSEREDS